MEKGQTLLEAQLKKAQKKVKGPGRPKKEDEANINISFDAADTVELVKSLYKDDYGNPFILTAGQEEIFNSIFFKGGPDGQNRIHIKTYTQYGKSDVISMAVLTRAVTYPEKWALIAPSQAKAKIIMGYMIKHLFENEFMAERFKIKPGESIENVRRERSKNRLTFDIGNNQIGDVFILSAESKIKSEDVGNSLMGFGAPNVVMDEAALISDESDAKAMRMVGGFTDFGTDFVVKVGNPFKRNHFLLAQRDPAYYKIDIDCKRGIKEKRLTQKFVDEMSEKPFYGVLYQNKFPRADDIDRKGWSQLILEDEIRKAMVKDDEVIEHVGEKRIGNDIARGGANKTVWVLSSMNYKEIVGTSGQDNLIEIGSQGILYMEEYEVFPQNFFVDAIAVGGGVADSLFSEQKAIVAVNVGVVSLQPGRFTNLRAEAYWAFREWLKKGGRLSNDERWLELSDIKYKPDSRGRVRIMSKDEMIGQGIDSPDVADAAMLVHTRREHRDISEKMKKRKMKRRKNRNRGLAFRMGGY